MLNNYIFRNNPFIRLTVPFIIGLFFSYNYPISLNIISLIFFMVFFLLLIFYKLSRKYEYQNLFGIAVYLFFFIYGLFYISLQQEKLKDQSKIPEKYVSCKGYIKEILSIKDNQIRFVIKVNKNEKLFLPDNILCDLNFSGSSQVFTIGTVVQFYGYLMRISPAKNPVTFDYSRYLYNKNILFRIVLKENNYAITGYKNNILTFSYKVRTKISEILSKYKLKDSNKSVIEAITIGLRSNLDMDTIKLFQSGGAMHILALSGLHVGIIYFIINTFLNFFKGQISKFLRLIIVISLLIFFAFVGGLRPSMVRATFMCCLFQIGKYFNKNASTLNSLASSALFLLLINPMNIIDAGFVMSYLAVLGIILFNKPIYNSIFLKNSILNKIWELFSISISAQILTLPYCLMTFNQFSPYFWLSSIVIVPMVPVIIITAMITIIIGCIGIYPLFLSIINNAIVNLMLWGLKIIKQLPYSLINSIHITNYDFIFFYIIIAIIYIVIYSRKTKLLIFGFALTLIFYLVVDSLVVYSISKTNKILVLYQKNQSSPVLLKGFNAYILDEEKDNLNFFKQFEYSIYKGKKVNFKIISYIPENEILNIENNIFITRIGENIFFSIANKKGIIVKEKLYSELVNNSSIEWIIFKTANNKDTYNFNYALFENKKIIFESIKNYKKLEQLKKEFSKTRFHVIKLNGAYIEKI